MAGKVDLKLLARYLAARNWRMRQQAQAVVGGTGGVEANPPAPENAMLWPGDTEMLWPDETEILWPV